MKIKQIAFYFISFLLLSACSRNDYTEVQVDNDKDKINTFLTVYAPSMKLPQKATTRSSIQTSDEMSVNNVTILILERENDVYRYKYQTNARNLSGGEGTYHFNAYLSASENPVKLFFIANMLTIPLLETGDTEEILKNKINLSFSAGWIKKDFPMFGETSLPGLTEEGANLTSTLVRSIARVDVANYSDDFDLRTIQVYRANDKIQVIPDEMTNNIVRSVSIPQGTVSTIKTDIVTVSGATSTSEIYLPESAVIEEEGDRKNATCVIVGGIYKGDTNITYYRMDFVPDSKPELFGQILRNHRYVFQIDKVLGSGWQTPDDAANNDPSQIESNIKEWNSETIYMEFDGYHHLGVSTRNVYLEYHEGFSSTVQVDTDLDNYNVYWLTNENEKDPSGTQMGWGDSSVSPDGLYTMKIATNGQSIIITSRTENSGNESFTGSFRIEAGRMRVQVWIEQDIARSGARQIYILSVRADQIGGFGGTILGQNYAASDRTKHLVSKLNNKENFGPMGKVHFDGFIFGATPLNDVPATTANLFDVLHFPYPAIPNATTAETVYNWVKSSKNRVLIFHYDNLSVNAELKNKFGLTTQSVKLAVNSPQNSPAYIHPDALPVILNGPFGSVDINASFRTYDTTQGMIEMEEAARHNITPILVTRANSENPEGVVLGIDFKNQIVYCGDIDFYSRHTSTSHKGEAISENDNILKDNNADILMSNLFAWIAKTVLAE